MITASCAPCRRRGKRIPGIVNYCRLARNIWWLHALRWNAETSMLKGAARFE
jgi:hypothetical protein